MPQPGYDCPPTVRITLAGVQLATASSHAESRLRPRSIDSTGFIERQLGAAALEHPLERSQHVEGPIAHREDLAARFDLCRHALGVEHRHQFVGPQRRESRVQERALAAERFDDAAARRSRG